MEKHLDLKIKTFCGNSKISLQDRTRWHDVFDNNQVLIFTPQVFLNLLTHKILCKLKFPTSASFIIRKENIFSNG
jgi:hypothetical protein